MWRLDPETLWLEIVNFGLAVAVLVCWTLVGAAVVRGLRERARRRRDQIVSLAPSTAAPQRELGVTLADGGLPVANASKPCKEGDSSCDAPF